MKYNNVAKHAHKYNKSSVHTDKKKHSKLNAPWQMEELLEEGVVEYEELSNFDDNIKQNT